MVMGLYPPFSLHNLFHLGFRGYTSRIWEYIITSPFFLYVTAYRSLTISYVLFSIQGLGVLSLAVVTVVTVGFQHYNGCMLVHVHALLGVFHTSRNRIG